MAVGKVLARGQVTLPKAIRRAACLKPGDVVVFQVTAPGIVELRALPRLHLSEALERYRILRRVDDASDRAEWQAIAARRDVIGKLGE